MIVFSLVLGVAIVATLIPVGRAARVDPALSFRRSADL